MILHLPVKTRFKGTVTAVSRKVCPKSGKALCTCLTCEGSLLGKVVDVQMANNTIFSGWLTQVVQDIANGTTLASPNVLAFSKEVVAVSPEPTELTDEFRAPTNVFSSGSTMQILSTLGSTEFNSPSGTIKSIGFYYGGATTTLETGFLGSLINDLNVSKDSSTEVTFQYDITFTSAT